MAENTPPPPLNLAKLARVAIQPSPMATDRLYNAVRVQLISPPPEETLNFRRTSRSTPFTPSILADDQQTSKRKRAGQPQPQPQEATPNPKPRKQSRHQPVSNHSPTRTSSPITTPSKPKRQPVVKSPHALNPDADFIPDLPLDIPRRSVASARARRTTPIPHYEPPSETFTPPREVIITPSISKSSKRKTNTKQSTAKGKKLLKVLIPAPSIKKELPVIDLSAPMPPPSPSDDPLLLSGPILPPSSTPTRPSKHRERREVDVTSVPSIASSLPPSSCPVDEMECAQPFDWTRHTEPEGSTDLSMMDMNEDDVDVPRLPLFNLNLGDLPASSDGGWSDSDDDDATLRDGGGHDEHVEGEGEYTGKWRMLTVRTKLDPPSSATRDRMEEWGRPITPFPKRLAKLDLLEEVHEEEAAGQETDMFKDREASDEEEEREVREMSIPLHDEDQQEEQEISVEFESQDLEILDPVMPRPFDCDVSAEDLVVYDTGELPNAEVAPQEELEDASLDVSFGQHDDNQLSTVIFDPGMHAEDEEEQEVRQMSVEFDDGEDRYLTHGQNEAASPAFFLSPNQETGLRLGSPGPSSAANDLSCFTRASPADVDELMEDPVAMPREPRVFAAVDENAAEVIDGDSSDEVESDFEDAGVVKITSTDPKAAARAAAILKQHDYDCFTKIVMMERRRQSCSGVDKLTKMARRKTMSGGGIVKGKDKGSEKKRRRSVGVIGDRVYIPGSPATTLPELLREAEAEVVAGTPMKEVGIRDPFKTPLPQSGYPPAVAVPLPLLDFLGEQRTWTKEDWKQLDACFTDERLEVGHRLEVDEGEEGLASIDRVRVGDVVQRFVLSMGGEGIVDSFGDEWSRHNISRRVKALQNKQRSGNAAPPTTPYTPSPGRIVSGTTPSIEVPDFTPLGRQLRPVFPLPVVENAPFANLSQRYEGSKRKLPASLLAPRYSHLLEEAVSISQMGTKVLEVPVGGTTQDPDASIGEEEAATDALSTLVDDEDVSLASTASRVGRLPTTPATIGKRVKGFLSSYLPTLSKTAVLPGPRTVKQRSHKAGLPLPPPEVLEKPRGPVSTPVRPPLPKQIAPKELVQLNPAPQLLTKASMIPRVKKPQRLVELQPLPPQSPPKPIAVPRPRRSSGSVKDLVRSFEDLEKHRGSSVRKGELKRVKSNADWKTTIGTGNRPGWKP